MPVKASCFIIGMTGGSLKAEGFGDGVCKRSYPQAAFEAATDLILFKIASKNCQES